MKRDDFIDLLSRVKGCTFAALDAETKPSPGVRKVTMNEQVLLFSMRSGSGYENMVKRRLEEIGRDPNGFSVGDLPWGTRIDNTPCISHNDKIYVQMVVIRSGTSECFVGSRKVDCAAFGKKSSGYGQGLPDDRRVVIHTYCLDNIVRLTLLGETLKQRA